MLLLFLSQKQYKVKLQNWNNMQTAIKCIAQWVGASPMYMDNSIVFGRWRQCAHDLTHFLGPTQVHILNGVLINSALFAQLTSDCPTLYNREPLHPQNCSFAWGYLDPDLTRGSLDPFHSASHIASRSVQPFLHSLLQSPILHNGPLLPPSKLPLRMGDLDPI